ncbi:MAG: hypothetical protein HQL51_15130, partial [Magnetococcales bacterium]|nr:hypothetical protein [Magnetococcales bacterium]
RMDLPLLGDAPFLAVNGDILWDFDPAALIQAFDPARMTALLLLVESPADAPGDFLLAADGRLSRAPRVEPGDPAKGWTYSGLQMLSPGALAHFPVEPFSLNRFYDDAIAAGTLFGIRLPGRWADVGTPERLEKARREWPALPPLATGPESRALSR